MWLKVGSDEDQVYKACVTSPSLGGRVAPWHCAKGPRPKGARAMAVIAATDDGSMISLNNFYRLKMNYCYNLNSIEKSKFFGEGSS